MWFFDAAQPALRRATIASRTMNCRAVTRDQHYRLPRTEWHEAAPEQYIQWSPTSMKQTRADKAAAIQSETAGATMRDFLMSKEALVRDGFAFALATGE
jgi:hypothetical protein